MDGDNTNVEMEKPVRNRRKVVLISIIVLVIVVTIAGGVVWFLINKNKPQQEQDLTPECAKMVNIDSVVSCIEDTWYDKYRSEFESMNSDEEGNELEKKITVDAYDENIKWFRENDDLNKVAILIAAKIRYMDEVKSCESLSEYVSRLEQEEFADGHWMTILTAMVYNTKNCIEDSVRAPWREKLVVIENKLEEQWLKESL